MPSEPTPPTPDPPGKALDLYEAKYMQGTAVVRSKTRAGWQAPAFAGATAIFVAVWCATHANLGLPVGLLLAAVILLLGLFFSVMRVRVSTDFVDVHYGLIGPKIPTAAIESVEAVVHDHRSWLRWGISPMGKGAWLYSIAGDEGRAVKVVWRDPSGRLRTHYIGSPDHTQLAASILEAKQASLSAAKDAPPRALEATLEDDPEFRR